MTLRGSRAPWDGYGRAHSRSGVFGAPRYSAGLSGSRGMVTALVLVIVLGAVLTLVVDLDRPRDGFLQVSQQPLIDLATQIGAP